MIPEIYRDHLVARARGHWSNGHPIPLDLFAEMLGEGIDVDAEECSYSQYCALIDD